MHGASVAELVDAVDSKSTVRKDLGFESPHSYHCMRCLRLPPMARPRDPDGVAQTPMTDKWHNRIMA